MPSMAAKKERKSLPPWWHYLAVAESIPATKLPADFLSCKRKRNLIRSAHRADVVPFLAASLAFHSPASTWPSVAGESQPSRWVSIPVHSYKIHRATAFNPVCFPGKDFLFFFFLDSWVTISSPPPQQLRRLDSENAVPRRDLLYPPPRPVLLIMPQESRWPAFLEGGSFRFGWSPIASALHHDVFLSFSSFCIFGLLLTSKLLQRK